ncbi:hypothetical protein EOM82_07385, partial [bacterium]|nr:hypothetical protein [bacterium]
MKDKDFLKLAALNAKIDKEDLRNKILTEKKRKSVWLSPKAASVAASFILVVIFAAIFINNMTFSPYNESEDNLSYAITTKSDFSVSIEASDMIYIA